MYPLKKYSLGAAPGEKEEEKEEMLSFFPQRTHPNGHFPDRLIHS